ncbi:MAG: glycosyltransferase family 4 protein [Anaerolineae bacterium]
MPDLPSTPRIGYNAALLSYSDDYRGAGIHRYIARLLPALAALGEYDITAFTPEPLAAERLPRAIEVRRAPAMAASPLGRIAWEQTRLPGEVRRSGARVYHGAAYAMPALCPTPAVVTVHDLSFERLPETLPLLQRRYLGLATRLAVRRAQALIAVSQFTRRELVDALGAAPDRVHVVHNGIEPAFRPAPPSAQAAVRERYGLAGPFALTLGTLQPRKNLVTLMRGYAALRARDPDTPPLAVIGGAGWGGVHPAKLADELGVGGQVRVLGFVPDDDLPALYSSCSVFAYPSLYEGFGLPVAEALACGAPTLVAAASSLPEVGGPAVVQVEPGDHEAGAAALRNLLGDDSRRRSLRIAGPERAKRFSWERAARETADVYGMVLSEAADMEAARAHA